MPTIVGILWFMNRKNFLLSRVEHEKSFLTSGPGLIKKILSIYRNFEAEQLEMYMTYYMYYVV